MNTVVFVDEEHLLLDKLVSWFSEYKPNWQVYTATSAEPAMQLLEKHSVDCVVSDIDLPDMNGAQLLCHVAKKQPDAVRIALSKNKDAELTLESLHATHRFIAKPDNGEQVSQAIERSLQLREQLHDPALRRLITGITTLPILPEIYDRLMLELASEDFSIAVVTRIIESDISLSATLLKVVNSAYYGLLRHVESPSHAVHLLGIELVKNILLSEKIVSQFKQFAPGAQRVNELNIQASIRGVLANRFARVAKMVVVTGMLDMDSLQSHDFHPDVIGSSILGLWSLPDTIVEAVLHQSNPENLDFNDDALSPLHVLNAIRRLEAAFANNNKCIDQNFRAETVFGDTSLELLHLW